MKIGVIVEGPSDKKFWDRILHKFTEDMWFDVRVLKNKQQAIRNTPRMVDMFRSAGMDHVIVLVDRDDDACPIAVREQFDDSIKPELERDRSERYCHLAVAERNLESWLISSANAIGLLFPNCDYECPSETGSKRPGKVLKSLWESKYGGASFNKIEFANLVATEFDPCDAAEHSKSFARFGAITSITANC